MMKINNSSFDLGVSLAHLLHEIISTNNYTHTYFMSFVSPARIGVDNFNAIQKAFIHSVNRIAIKSVYPSNKWGQKERIFFYN